MKLFKDVLSQAIASLENKSASSLGKDLGIAQSQMSAFTSGEGLPKDDNLKKLCGAFSPELSAKLAKSWVQERLGPDLADAILAVSRDGGSHLERLFSALPKSTQDAFLTLMKETLTSEDLRGSLEQLASYISPEPVAATSEKKGDEDTFPPEDTRQPKDQPPASHPRKSKSSNPIFEVKGILGKKDLKPSADDLSASRLNEATEEQEEVEQLRKRLDELTKEKGSQTR